MSHRFLLLTPVLVLAATAVIVLPALSSARAADLTIIVEGDIAAGGTVSIGFYDAPEKFRKEDATVAQLRLQPMDGKAAVTLRNLPTGAYAVAVYFDANNNGKLDANLIGLPVEPYGFSNAARGNFGPPNFEAAAVAVGASGSETRISLTR